MLTAPVEGLGTETSLQNITYGHCRSALERFCLPIGLQDHRPTKATQAGRCASGPDAVSGQALPLRGCSSAFMGAGQELSTCGYSPKSSTTNRNCSSADSRSSTMSAASTSGSGKFAVSSRDSSRIQKISRLALSLATNSSYG